MVDRCVELTKSLADAITMLEATATALRDYRKAGDADLVSIACGKLRADLAKYGVSVPA